jgi:chromosome partitioning protein
LVLIPVQPSPYDIWACADLVDLIKARQEVTDGRPKTAFVISRAIKRTILGREVREALEEHALPIFEQGTAQRVIYANSAASGSTPLEAEPDGEAAEEIRRLVEELKRFVGQEVPNVAHG